MSSVGSPKKPMSNLGRDIPRRMRLNSASQLPFDYCTTPGGTLFSTTPGGTRIIYDRSFLINLRTSPMARSPPCGMPNIAGVTSPSTNGKENKLNMRGKARSSSLSVNAPVFSPSSRASPTNNITGSSSAEALMTQVNTATTTPIIANAITKNETTNENTGDMPVDEPQFQFDM